MPELENAKGTRDILPEEKILRDKTTRQLTEVFELYGYVPIETPVLMRYEVLSAKFAAGEESDAMKETFKLKDQGERSLGLRFDLTIPFSKFVGLNPMIKMPFKRYELGKVYRDGPIKLGRYREFWQCDVDIVGTASMVADAEIILLALDAFKRMGLNAYIEFNNRKLLQGLLLDCGIENNNSMLMAAMVSIDKLDKFGREVVLKEMSERGIRMDIGDSILALFENFARLQNNAEKINFLKSIAKCELAKQGLQEIEELMKFLDSCESESIVLNISLARGLGYYTGTVFEGYLRSSKIASSVCGGGRYDEMIGAYIGTGLKYPAVGISFGLDVICDAIKLLGKAQEKTVAQVYIIPIQTQKQCFELAKVLRENNIRTDMDLIGRGISKNLDYASKLGIPFVIFVGPDELSQGKVKLRNMKTGEEQLICVEEVCSLLVSI